MSTVKEFYDEYEAKLLMDFVQGNPRIIEAIKFAKSFSLRKDVRSILDLGCGLGWSTYEFARNFPDCKVTGVDISPKLLGIAMKVFNSRNLNYVALDLTSGFGPLNNQYELITMIDVFEHISSDKRRKFYSDIQGVLGESFNILLTCPTKLHQKHLRDFKPSALQPIDEDVDFRVLQEFADAVGGEVVHFELKSIWVENDYFHAVITNNLNYGLKIRDVSDVDVIRKSLRKKMLKNSGIALPQVPRSYSRLVQAFR